MLQFLLLVLFAIKFSTSRPSYSYDNLTQCGNLHLHMTQHYDYYKKAVIQIRFSSLAELNQSTCTEAMYYIIELRLHPYRPIHIGNNFDIRNLLKVFKFMSYSKPSVTLHSVNGFDLRIASDSVNNEIKFFELLDVKFDFYLNDSVLVTAELCSRDTMLSLDFLGPVESLILSRNAIYTTHVCPYVFVKTKVNFIWFEEVTNSLLYKNRLGFLSVNETLNTSISSVIFGLAYEKVTSQLLSRSVFSQIECLYLKGIISEIEHDLFKDFSRLKLVYLMPDNIKMLFHANAGLKWLDFLIDKTRIIFHDKLTLFKKSYQYPDKDLCLFKEFPHERHVFPTIIEANHEKCTCTILWLIQYSKEYMDSGN